MSTVSIDIANVRATATSTTDRATKARRSLVRDIGIVLGRELKPTLRDPFSLLFGMIQPIVFLALFGPLLVGSLGGQGTTRSAAASGSGSCRRSWP